MADTPTLPALQLPVAFLRFWPGGADLAETVDELPKIPGVRRLGPRLLAVYPIAGRGEIFDLAARLAGALLVRRSRRPGGDALPGVLIYPGKVGFGREAEPVVDTLFEDLERRGPRMPEGKIVLTSYVASWLRGRYEVIDAGIYDAPSGVRVPLFELGSERSVPEPWHNPEMLGRRPRVRRKRLEDQLAQALDDNPCRITGPLGVGKTRILADTLPAESGPKIWVGLGRALPSLPLLARTLSRELRLHLPDAGIEPERLKGLDSPSRAELLVTWLRVAKTRLGASPWLICDVAETTTDGDLDLLRSLLGNEQFSDCCRLVVLERSGRSRMAALEDAGYELRTVPVQAFFPEESDAHSEELLQGLELMAPVRERFLDSAQGHPFALEEGLLRLVHRGLIRRVYGSFFYAGGDEVVYEPSERLVRHVEAEVHRLGEPMPLRVLAVAEEPISSDHLRRACAELGLDLDLGWHRDYESAGWLRPVADGHLDFACPAYGQALATTVSADGRRSLRRALGGVLAESGPGSGWTAYRLMAGSPEALPSLLDFSRDSNENASREEVFNALWHEYRAHRESNGDEATELEILWALLPLARRLGCLAQLQRELRRGVELARGNEQRYVALVA
ncbi:MAG: hypothetical protein MI919_27475, partial [Holophagales bacterium]|nr:hypothetical protein [Holophagales bacterium]